MIIKPTPFNIVPIVFMIWAFWAYDKSKDLFGLGRLYLVGFTFLTVTIIILDYFAQKRYHKYGKIVFIELVLLAGIFLIYSYTQRTKNLILAEGFNKTYVTIVYGVNSANKLPVVLPNWHAKIPIPLSGILLTTTDFETDLPHTKMLTSKGEELNSDATNLSFIKFINEEMEVNGEVYKYRSWMVAQTTNFTYSSDDIAKYKEDLRTSLTNLITEN
ncbi:MAG: hypothetical protein AAGI07_07955 [Bacteroidota bacterium]